MMNLNMMKLNQQPDHHGFENGSDASPASPALPRFL